MSQGSRALRGLEVVDEARNPRRAGRSLEIVRSVDTSKLCAPGVPGRRLGGGRVGSERSWERRREAARSTSKGVGSPSTRSEGARSGESGRASPGSGGRGERVCLGRRSRSGSSRSCARLAGRAASRLVFGPVAGGSRSRGPWGQALEGHDTRRASALGFGRGERIRGGSKAPKRVKSGERATTGRDAQGDREPATAKGSPWRAGEPGNCVDWRGRRGNRGRQRRVSRSARGWDDRRGAAGLERGAVLVVRGTL